jgi:hypothetical protein
MTYMNEDEKNQLLVGLLNKAEKVSLVHVYFGAIPFGFTASPLPHISHPFV